MPSDEMSGDQDPYSRVDYRRFVAWPERIRRESPLLLRLLSRAPEASVIDLGCGSGEHCRFLAGEGFAVVGLDRSESMIAKATEEPVPPNLTFLLGDIRQADREAARRFGAALSLGNTLVHLTEEEGLRAAFQAVRKVLLPGGLFLFQILNYQRIFEQKVRHLPLNFRKQEDGEILFLRLMEPLPGGRVRFCPSTLHYDPSADPPLKVVRSRLVDLRGWTRTELDPLLEELGFGIESVFGDLSGGEFAPERSQDLVMLVRAKQPGGPA